jgi:hypothetical protein
MRMMRIGTPLALISINSPWGALLPSYCPEYLLSIGGAAIGAVADAQSKYRVRWSERLRCPSPVSGYREFLTQGCMVVPPRSRARDLFAVDLRVP